MTNVDRNLGVSEPWGRATEKEIEDLKKRLRKLEGGRQVQAKTQSILADLIAKADVQDQLLQSQLDAQDIVTYADGPPSLGIDDPGDPDAGGEVFPAPNPSEGENSSGTGGDDDPFPPFEPDESIFEPEHRWVQEDPLTGVIEGEWALVDGVWEPRQVGSDYVADGAIIRDKIEQAVLDDIDEANSNANEAVIAANGKNTIYRGPSSPTPPANGFNEGDTWFDTSDGDTTIKTWTGSAWTVQEVGTESLAVGAITAESGIIASLDAGVISTGTLNADRIDSRSITADKLLIGGSTNLIPNGAGEIRGLGGWISKSITNVSFVSDTPLDPGLPGSFACDPGTGTVVPGGEFFDIDVEREYLFEVWLKSSLPNSRMYIELRDENGAHAIQGFSAVEGYPLPGNSSNYLVNNLAVPTVWTKYASRIRLRPTATQKVRIGSVYFNHGAGSERNAQQFIAGMRLVPSVGGTLIEDDAITTTKIAADAIEADHIKANAITAPKIGAGAVVAEKIASNAITTDKLAANAITAKHTITGAVLRTSASGARTQITGSGLQVFNSSNQELVRVGHGISTGMSVRPPGGSSLVPLAPMVFGGGYGRVTSTVNLPVSGFGYSGWHLMGPSSSVTSPTGRILLIWSVVPADDSGAGIVDSYMGATTDNRAGGMGVSPGPNSGSNITWYRDVDVRGKASVLSTQGPLGSTSMCVLDVPSNTQVWPRIRMRGEGIGAGSVTIRVGLRVFFALPV